MTKSSLLPFILLGLSVLSASAQVSARPPNFIVFLCDNLGYGDTAPYGSTLHRTPNLDRLAKEGRMFTHFYTSANVCTPSRAGLMTGCYAQRVSLYQNAHHGPVLQPGEPIGLHPDEVTTAVMGTPSRNSTGRPVRSWAPWNGSD